MLSFLSVKRKPGWMAILPHGEEVTLAHVVRPAAGRPEVRLLDTFAAGSDLRGALQRLRGTRQLASYSCTTLIRAGDASLTALDPPQVPREERKEALRWALKELVSYPVESACIDVLDIPGDGLPSGRVPGVLVASAAEEAVRACVSPFEEAGVSLAAVDIHEMAQRNVAALFEDDNRGLAFLRIDESGMMLTLSFKGELVAVRRGEMSTHQLMECEGDVCLRVRERLTLELQRSLDNFDRQYSHIPISKMVLSCSPPVEKLADELRESLYVPLVEMDLAKVIDFPAVPELRDVSCQARNLLALGAALRTLPKPEEKR